MIYMKQTQLTQKQQKLLAVIQSDFPVEEHPFRTLAALVGWPENEVIDTTRLLIENETIRAFSPVFEARMLGYVSTLAAAEIDMKRIDELARELQTVTEITHNYIRDFSLNMWFTISAQNNTIRQNIFRFVEQYTGVSRIFNLPAIRVYKVNAVFGVQKSSQSRARQKSDYTPLNEHEKRIVRCLQEGIPMVENPYKVIADKLETDESFIIDTINTWLETGVIRRFGARLNHRKAGFTANTLAAWRCDDYDQLGEMFASFSWVSHCYRRPSYSEWPYELYTMVHAQSEDELHDVLATMKSNAPGAEMITLKTVKELKKTTMMYFLEDGRWDTPKHE